MGSVYMKRGRWYLRHRDQHGRWRDRASTARTKTEAKRLVGELETRFERARLGLETLPPEDGGGTLGELLTWWLKTYSTGSPSHDRNVSTLRKHFLSPGIADLLLVEVTSGKIEAFLQDKAEALAPQTLNHLRRFLLTAFNCATRAGRWQGTNPVAEVRRRRVPKGKPEFLRLHEVPPVLRAVPERWRPLFATAIYTGMRKGELLGLQKADVDFATGLICVSRSYDHDATKGGHAEAIPIAGELVPYLRAAIAASPSNLVFPDPDGAMLSRHTPLEEVLRRALAHAGIVTGYIHVCRKKGCAHREPAQDAQLRHCPTHGMKLWPKAQVRPIRFHDLRHTTGSLLLMAGANPAAVQKILRHSDPRITTEVYGHLLPGYLRSEIDRLAFGPKDTVADSKESQLAATDTKDFAATVLPANQNSSLAPLSGEPSDEVQISETPSEYSEGASAGWTGLEPAASGVTGRRYNQLNYHPMPQRLKASNSGRTYLLGRAAGVNRLLRLLRLPRR
jgi:integrase